MDNNTGIKRKSRYSGWLKLVLELIAVFTGISAGFFFDNFREEKANQKMEQKYLESFHTNLASDSIEIQSHILANQNNLDISSRAVYNMQTEGISLDSSLAVIQVMASYNNLNLQDATYESIVNSGNLGLIRDFDIREQIVNYYRRLDDLQYVEDVYNNYINDYVLPFIFSNMDIISGEVTEEFNPGDREFRNLTSGYYVIANQNMEMLMSLDSVNHALKNSIFLTMN